MGYHTKEHTSKARQHGKPLHDQVRRESIPGWPGFVVTIDGIVYREVDGGYALVQHCYRRQSCDGTKVKVVYLDGKRIEVWKLVWFAFGGGNTKGLTVSYDDHNYRNCSLSNLSVVDPRYPTKHLRSDLVPKRSALLP